MSCEWENKTFKWGENKEIPYCAVCEEECEEKRCDECLWKNECE
ncbi:MAG: hypothetical protein ACRC5T_09110 [Cetobacterium sp.]